VHELGAGALIIDTNPIFINVYDQLSALALRHAIPTMGFDRPFVAAGGLAKYGASGGGLAEAYQIIGGYAGKILKGEKPGDLPVQRATKFELVINLKTAKALGLTIPETLLATADEVIQ
jgi:putative ABC transport system substrate-binding protein